MKRTLIIFLLFLFINEVYGQAFLNEKEYLNSPAVSLEAKMFYKGKVRIFDSDTLKRLLDSLGTTNNSTRPFYILLVSRLIEKADGGVGEMVFTSCVNLFENKPDALLEFLYADNKLTRGFKLDWADAIVRGTELARSENARQHIDKLKPGILKKIKQRNKADLEDFYSRIYKQL